MSTPAKEIPERSHRFGQRLGPLVVVLFLVALGGSVIFATRRPLPGIGLVATLVASGIGMLRTAAKRERESAMAELARLRAVSPPAGDGWRKLLEHEGLERLIGDLAARVRPAVRLTTRPLEDAPVVGRSRVGGVPDLPADLSWPEHEGLPMMFLAQLDLAEVRRSLPGSPLPASGHLWFFYSTAQPWGFDPKHAGGSRVIHRPQGTSLAPATPPRSLSAEARFEPCAVSFEVYEDLPEIDEGPRLDDDESERYVEIRGYLSGGGTDTSHKLLGFADPIQQPMELECQLVTNGIYCGSPSGYAAPRARALAAGQAAWRLLLQLDSDENAGMMWGDAGRLYFWMREDDLVERRFDKAWMILQCH